MTDAQEIPRTTSDLEQNADIRHALRQIGSTNRVRRRFDLSSGSRWALAALVSVCVLAALLVYAARGDVLPFLTGHGAVIERISLGSVIIGVLLVSAKLAEEFVIRRVDDDASRFNLRRILKLVVALAVGLLLLSLVFSNWYTALASLGLMSLILGFALQTPVTSFIGWVYILVHTPYRVGDRIRIGDATGDVIDIGYFDTTLWEFGGQYLSTDHPSGRIIKFPNSNVLNAAVYNYSWPLFPYIWNEVKFHIGYGSDLGFVAATMERVVSEELGEAMIERVGRYRDLLVRTPVDEIQVQEKPVVLFRVGDNTWLEAIVRYLVDPKQAGPVKTVLIRRILERFNSEPERAQLPRGDAR